MGIGQHFGWIESYIDYGVADGLIILANNAVWYSGMSYEESQTRQWAVDDTFWYLYGFLNGFAIAVSSAIDNYNASASWDQLAFGSTFLTELNQNSSNELARYRIGISSQLSIGSYGAGLLALLGGSPSEAEQWSSLVQSVGFDLLFRSADIWYYMWQYGQDNPDRDFWGDYAATLAMDDLAFRLIDFGAFWVDVVGGYPHDGVVPTGSMAFPGGDNGYAIAGVSHTHETSSVASGQVMLSVLESLRNSP